MKMKFKPALIPMWVTYFFLMLTDGMTFPYMNLQMRSLGLTLEDITLVNGLIPIIAIAGPPLLGYVGDKLGYKVVFMITILMCMLLPTSFNFLPVYREHKSKIAIDARLNSSGSFDTDSLVWFGKYSHEGINCMDTIENTTIQKIECNEISYDVDLKIDTYNVFNVTRKECDNIQTFSCKYIFKENVSVEAQTYCSVIIEDGVGVATEGSHSVTFWIYFLLRSIYIIMTYGLFNITDAAATTIARREKSSYSLMLFCGNIGSLIPPFIVGPLVDNINLGSTFFDCITGVEVIPKDYKLPHFIADGCFLLMGIFVFFFLDVIVEKSPKKMSLKEEFEWLINPAALSFYCFVFMFGVHFSAGDIFLFIYAEEDLGTSVSFLGWINETQYVSGLIILPFGGFIIRKAGHANIYCLAFFMMSVRTVAWAFPFLSPPYEFIAYGFIDILKWLYMAAYIEYTAKIAPSRLTATAIALTTTLSWIVGSGVGTLIAGQIVSVYSMRIMFIIFGVFGCCFSSFYWMMYHLIIKHFEPNYSNEERNGTSEEENKTQNEVVQLSNSIETNSMHMTPM